MSDTVKGNNPFSEADPRHQIWEVASHAIQEFLADARAHVGGSDNLYGEALDVFTARFDSAAQPVAALVANYPAADTYAAALRQAVDEEMERASQWCPDFLSRDDFLRDLRSRLSQRQAHWEGQALQYARESVMRRMQPPRDERAGGPMSSVGPNLEAPSTAEGGSADASGSPGGNQVVPPSMAGPGDAKPSVGGGVPRAPKAPRGSLKYATIDKTLLEIAEAGPESHEAVFKSLDKRIRVPNAELFESAGSWMGGFRRNPPAAGVGCPSAGPSSSYHHFCGAQSSRSSYFR